MGLLWLLYAYFARFLQLGQDEDVYQTVDALFTAVTARNDKLLTQCEQRLRSHRDAGKIPPATAAYLERRIASAHQGRWQAAAQSLYSFMLAQRREGSGERTSGRAGAVRSRKSKAPQ